MEFLLEKICCKRRERENQMDLGKRIRELRTKQGISLNELASKISVSPGFLSQIENGKSEPSLTTIKKISDGLSVTISNLFDEVEQKDHMFVKLNERVSMCNIGEGGVSIEFLAPFNRENIMEACVHVVDPLCRSGAQPYSHEGQEVFLVLEGKFQLVVDEKCFNMEAGDSYYLSDCSLPHMFVNLSKQEKSKMLCVTNPPFFYDCKKGQ